VLNASDNPPKKLSNFKQTRNADAFLDGLIALSTPGMRVNLWDESPLYMNPAAMNFMIAKVLAEGKGDTVSSEVSRSANL
jgi:hypothetical protein